MLPMHASWFPLSLMYMSLLQANQVRQQRRVKPKVIKGNIFLKKKPEPRPEPTLNQGLGMTGVTVERLVEQDPVDAKFAEASHRQLSDFSTWSALPRTDFMWEAIAFSVFQN